MIQIFLKGLLIGFSVAAPVGPIALLILRRSLSEGKMSGIVSGLGAATADLLCGLVAALGLGVVTAMIDAHRNAFQLTGGLFMIVFGFITFKAKDPSAADRPLHERNLFVAYVFTLLLTLSNPLTLLGMVGVVAAAGMGGPEHTILENLVLGGGIFLGSACWWGTLCSIAGWLGGKLGNRTLHVLNMLAGGMICAFGLWQLVSLAFHCLACEAPV